jgi:hypothetical protein
MTEDEHEVRSYGGSGRVDRREETGLGKPDTYQVAVKFPRSGEGCSRDSRGWCATRTASTVRSSARRWPQEAEVYRSGIPDY